MTRINVIPVDELVNKHLLAEYHEITRVFGLVKKSILKGLYPKNITIPKEYKLGTNHVKFFYDKLTYICNRYDELGDELIKRGYKINKIENIGDGIDTIWFNDYIPTTDAMEINRIRIFERLKGK